MQKNIQTPMMREDLYQEIILEHSRSPKNYGSLEGATHSALGYNPLCGDKIILRLILDSGNTISKIAFQGEGCAICLASTSLMTETVQGKKREEAQKIGKAFVSEITQDHPSSLPEALKVLEGVKKYPMRVKCATLCWHTLNNALEGKKEVAKTE